MYWKHKRRSKTTYCDKYILLDIETANNHALEKKDLKTWLVSAQIKFNGKTYFFRTPMQVVHWYKNLIKEYYLHEYRKIVTYIHNSSYDLSYLIPFFQRFLPNEERYGLYNSEHKIIMYNQYCFEFRCSYLLSGMSLEKWSDEMNVEHKKKVGLYDYDKIIYQDSVLSDQEMVYDIYDILSMEDCLQKQMEKHGDDITTIPLTSTGYCRRLFRNNAYKDKYYRKKYFLDNRLNVELYKYCKNAFAGGYTHNNRFFKSKIVTKDFIEGIPATEQIVTGCLIGHRDFRSMYPSNMRTRPLPFGKPKLHYDINKPFFRKNKRINIEEILKLYPKYSTISRIKIYEMELKNIDECSLPFMQVSKMFNRKGVRFLADNGRLLKTYSGTFETYVDNHTLKILNEQYNIKYLIIKVYKFHNEYMPKCLADTIDELFKDKSDYKILHQKAEEEKGLFAPETLEYAFLLLLSKRLLNSTYGMFATAPIRAKYDLDYSKEEPFVLLERMVTDKEIEIALDKFYNGQNNFLPYQVGIFITALSRYELYEYATKGVGYDRILYADTDSLFYLKNTETEKRIEALNKKHNEKAEELNAYIRNKNGKKIYYDVFEKESDCLAFKGLHSKCYGVITNKEELKITIAGIPEKTIIGMNGEKPIYLTREEEIAGITKEQKLQNNKINFNQYIGLNNLKHEYTFHVNTGTTSKYVYNEPNIQIIDGHRIQTCGGCVIQKLEEKKIKDIDIEIVERIEHV